MVEDFSKDLLFFDCAKDDYSFKGWSYQGTKVFDENGNQLADFSMADEMTFVAIWSAVEYPITYVLNDGTNNENNPSSYTVEDDAITLLDPARSGYTFMGWYRTSAFEQQATSIDPSEKSEVTLYAKWEIINYSISYELNGGTDSTPNPTSYTVEDAFDFSIPTRDGYTFLGWYDGETKYTVIAQGTTGTLSLEARWSADLNALSVTSENEAKGTVNVTTGSGYTDEAITVVANPASGCVFKGWYSGDTKVSDEAAFTFTMPASDYSLVARFWTQAEEEEAAWNAAHGVTPTLSNDGKTITYGLYPQTRVVDSALLAALDALGDSAKGVNGWYLYDEEYYAKLSATPYQSDYEFVDGATIVNGTIYWFKCEPIKWDVLSETDGEYYVLSDALLEVHRYGEFYSGEKDGHYSNNYQHSEIRAWLNGDFYGSAFTLGDSAIRTAEVDNSAATTDSSSNAYACANTQDKVFLLSYQDYLESDYGFSASKDSTSTRCCKPTDWARARGAYCSTSSSTLFNGWYWTRSPYSSESRYAWTVTYDGGLSCNYLDYTSLSVRPGLSVRIA